MVSIEPARERSMGSAQGLNAPCILGRRLDLEPVANYPRIGKQAVGIDWSEGSDAIDVEICKGGAEGCPLPEYRQPGQTRLIDLENKPLEQCLFVAYGKAVFGIVIDTVHRVTGRKPAIRRAQITTRGS